MNIPANVLPYNMNTAHFGTVAFWRSAAKHYGARSWATAMRRHALQHGKAVAILADDAGLFVERDPTQADKVTINKLPAGAVYWHRG